MLNPKKLINRILPFLCFIIIVNGLLGQNLSTNFTLDYNKSENLVNQKNFRAFDDVSFKINLFSKNKNLKLKYYISENNSFIDEIYYKKQKKYLLFKVGIFSHIDSEKIELSSGDMIESGNSYGIPRYLIEYKKHYKKLNLKFAISDGILDKNIINIEKPYYHDKRIKFEYNGFSLGLTHNAIWGGNVTGYGSQPSDLDDYFKIFFNQGGGADAVDTDKPNKLGDVFGSWNFGYKKLVNNFSFYAYHQFYFEDKSGLKMKNKMNNFDGLTGFSISNENSQILYERIKTSYQGGRVHPPGRDGYYWNGIYRNGWKYKDRIIGNIYLKPYANRVKINHFGIMHKFNNGTITAFYAKGKIYNISYNGGIPAEYEQDYTLNDFDTLREYSISYKFRILQNINFMITVENSLKKENNYFLTTTYFF